MTVFVLLYEPKVLLHAKTIAFQHPKKENNKKKAY